MRRSNVNTEGTEEPTSNVGVPNVENDPANELDANGVCVLRASCCPSVCSSCCSDLHCQLDSLLSLPGRSTDRHFLHFPLTTAAATLREPAPPEHRRDFVPSLSPPVEAVVHAVLKGKPGATVAKALGDGALLSEITAIISEPGSLPQMVHSDANWTDGVPRVITLFIAMHDLTEKNLGMTEFCVNTHRPESFPDDEWLPPPDAYSRPNPRALQKLQEAPPQNFEMEAGDVVAMYSTSWHRGGGNTSHQRRIVFTLSFMEVHDAVGAGHEDQGSLTVGNFRK